MPTSFGLGSPTNTVTGQNTATTSVKDDPFLVCWYDFGSPLCYPGSGSTITNLVPDRTALHSATITNATFVSDGPKSYFDFDGSTSQIDMGLTSVGQFEDNLGITAECWVKMDSFTSTDGDNAPSIIQRGSTNLTWDINAVSPSSFRWRMRGGAWTGASISNSGYSTNTWYHVVGTVRHIQTVFMRNGIYGDGVITIPPYLSRSEEFSARPFAGTSPADGYRYLTYGANPGAPNYPNGAWIKTAGANLLGAASLTASTTPTHGNNLYGSWTLSLPWTITYLGQSYDTIYVGTNSYIYFTNNFPTIGPQTGAFGPPSGSPHIAIHANDGYCSRIYYGTEGTGPNRTFRVRYEGDLGQKSGTLGSPTHVWEIKFFENSVNSFEIAMGPCSDRYYADMTLYVNGSAAAANTPSRTTTWQTAVATKFGEYVSDNSFNLDGKIASIKIYKKSLSDAEVKRNFDAEKIKYGY